MTRISSRRASYSSYLRIPQLGVQVFICRSIQHGMLNTAAEECVYLNSFLTLSRPFGERLYIPSYENFFKYLLTELTTG